MIMALEALGSLAVKFPTIAATLAVNTLSQFLVEPSPVLSKLAVDLGVSSLTSFTTNQKNQNGIRLIISLGM